MVMAMMSWVVCAMYICTLHLNVLMENQERFLRSSYLTAISGHLL